MTLPEVIGLVDGLFSLALILYLFMNDRKDGKQQRELSQEKDNKQAKELKAARDAHTEDLKQHSEDFAGLLEKSLVALRDMAGVTKDELRRIENTMTKAFAEELNKLKRRDE